MSENKSLETLKNVNIEKLSGVEPCQLLDKPCGVLIVFQYFMTTIGKSDRRQECEKRGKTNDTRKTMEERSIIFDSGIDNNSKYNIICICMV